MRVHHVLGVGKSWVSPLFFSFWLPNQDRENKPSVNQHKGKLIENHPRVQSDHKSRRWVATGRRRSCWELFLAIVEDNRVGNSKSRLDESLLVEGGKLFFLQRQALNEVSWDCCFNWLPDWIAPLDGAESKGYLLSWSSWDFAGVSCLAYHKVKSSLPLGSHTYHFLPRLAMRHVGEHIPRRQTNWGWGTQ